MTRVSQVVPMAAAGVLAALLLAGHGLVGSSPTDVPEATLVPSPAALVPWALTRPAGAARTVAAVDGVMVQALAGRGRAVLEARDQRTGDLRWQAEARSQDAVVTGPTVVVRAEGATEWVGTDERLAGYDLADGHLLWEKGTGGPARVEVMSGGAGSAGGTVALLTWPGNPRPGVVELLDARTGAVLRSTALPPRCARSGPGVGDTGSAVPFTRWVVVVADCSGRPTVLVYPVDAALPPRAVQLPGRAPRVTAQDAGTVLVQLDDGQLRLVDLPGATVRPVPPPVAAPAPAPDRWLAAELCHGQLLLQGPDLRLVAVDAATLHETWRTAPLATVTGTGCAADRAVVLTSARTAGSRYRLAAYPLAGGPPFTAELPSSSPDDRAELRVGEAFASVRFVANGPGATAGTVYGIPLR